MTMQGHTGLTATTIAVMSLVMDAIGTTASALKRAPPE